MIDGATNTVTATIPVGGEPDAVGVDPLATGTVYVANEGGNNVSVIERGHRHPSPPPFPSAAARPGWGWTRPPAPSTWPTSKAAPCR